MIPHRASWLHACSFHESSPSLLSVLHSKRLKHGSEQVIHLLKTPHELPHFSREKSKDILGLNELILHLSHKRLSHGLFRAFHLILLHKMDHLSWAIQWHLVMSFLLIVLCLRDIKIHWAVVTSGGDFLGFDDQQKPELDFKMLMLMYRQIIERPLTQLCLRFCGSGSVCYYWCWKMASPSSKTV